jgi:uncharacterized protein Yka (UPF0111/DUF47 family)
MITCATEKTLPETVIVGNLFLPLPETDFCDYMDEIDKLAKSAPKIKKACFSSQSIYYCIMELLIN